MGKKLTQYFRALKSFSTIWIFVSNSDSQKCVNFPSSRWEDQISNFIGWFCVKDKFLGQKTEREQFTVLTLFSKMKTLLSNSAQKNWVNFTWASEKVTISNFIALFCLTDKLLGQKTYTASLLSWHWRAMKSFSKI